MNTILSIEKPQLVVLNGDLVTGDATSQSNSSAYVDRVLTPLVENNVSWTSTYGNHDSATNLCADDVFRRERFHQNCFTQSMVSDPAAGLTNYFLPVFPHNSTAAEVPEVILWFFDTRGGSVCSESEDESDRMPDWVHQSVSPLCYLRNLCNRLLLGFDHGLLILKVTEWFIKTHSQLMAEYGRAVPSLAFFHIPTYALRAFQGTGIENYTEPGINDEIPVKQQGYFWDDDDYMGQDVPFMDALLRTEGILASFSGHDHGNDW